MGDAIHDVAIVQPARKPRWGRMTMAKGSNPIIKPDYSKADKKLDTKKQYQNEGVNDSLAEPQKISSVLPSL